MNIDDINKITEKASELKNRANSQVDLFELYLEAQILYDKAYEECCKSTEINQIQKDFLSTIYHYESLDCQSAYALKKKEFQKCQDISIQQIIIIDNIINKYKKNDIQDDKILDWYKFLVDHRITAETKRYFPIGKNYFDNKEYKKALFYFRRTEEIYNTRKKEELPEDFLTNHFLNYYILKFNISQCQVGILQTDIEEKEFLERQTIKELLQSCEYANEVMSISSDKIYKEGNEKINQLIKLLLKKSVNNWQILYDYTHSEHLLNLMNQVDSIKSNFIETNKLALKSKKIDYLLFYTHGFNTRGAWKDDLTEIISSGQRNTNIQFILLPWDYGEFKVKFFKKKSRKKAIEKFVERYNEILDTYGNCERKCLVAHSFGTYITGTAIQENENFICDKVVLAGNILDRKYDWNKLKDRKQIGEVFIEQSTNDGAVLFAKIFRKLCFQKWIGYAGRNGFIKNYDFITVLKSKSGHSGMLNKENMKNKWFPFLTN
jgi:hypothetical protein